MELTSDETRAVDALADFNVSYIDDKSNSECLIFRRQDPSYFRDIDVPLPRQEVKTLLDQLAFATLDHPNLVGFVQPSSGYAEFAIGGGDSGRRLGLISLEQIAQGPHEAENCIHSADEWQLPTLPYMSRASGLRSTEMHRLHLSSFTGGPCVEISNASPAALLLYARGTFYRNNISFNPTIKISYTNPVEKDKIFRETDEIVRSFIYELDVRNGKAVSVQRKQLPSSSARIARSFRSTTDIIRYPETRINHEAADLFGFATHARDNPPLAFLSYYQTLEYFMPGAVRQGALRKIRTELDDSMFDKREEHSLLRLLSIAERAIKSPEVNQMRTLVREYVRRDRLEEFTNFDWGNHFTSRGPIVGVEVINIKNSSKDLCDQVADRVYQIRNRIVHAKDDPRYGESRVLLPRSREADALYPDIELARFLAMEAVTFSQKS